MNGQDSQGVKKGAMINYSNWNIKNLLRHTGLGLILTLNSWSVFAQTQNAVPPVSDPSQEHIQGLKDQIEVARESNDLSAEFDLRAHLILDIIRLTYDNNLAYEMSLELEDFVDEHPELKGEAPEARRTQVMAMLLRDQFRYTEALEYFRKGKEVAKAHQWYPVYKETNAHVLEALSFLDRDSMVTEYFRESMAELDTFNWPEEETTPMKYRIIQLLGEHYYRNQQYDSSLKYMRISLEEDTDPEFLAARNKIISYVYMDLNKPDSAIVYAHRSLNYAVDASLQRDEFQALGILWVAYDAVGDTAKAYIYLKKYTEMKEVVQSYDDALHMSSLGIQKEQEKAQLQQALADQQLSSQRLVIIMVSVGLLLLIIGSVFIYNRLRFIRKQNKVIEQEKLRAEHSERVKDQFLANMSHEIRTPMNAILGMVNALKRRDHSEDQVLYLDTMKKSASNLLVILNDILDMSKLTHGNLDVSSVPFNLVDICEQVVFLLRERATEKGIELKLDIPVSFPEAIMGDPIRMNQILINLAGNAIKFTDEGAVTIALEQRGDVYSLKVQDTGIGIDEQTLPHIFEQFKQGEGPLDKRYSGTGLGLAISKHLIELQGGSILVESIPGEGSTFIAELPLIESEELPDDLELSEEQLKELGNTLSGIRILVAEDNEFNAMVIKDDLSWYIPDVKLTIVANGLQALEALKQENFDLVLMDVQMPEMNGYDTTQAIRRLDQGSEIPVIALTASLLKNQIDKCYEAGMNGYIPKPYTLRELMETIHQVMEKR